MVTLVSLSIALLVGIWLLNGNARQNYCKKGIELDFHPDVDGVLFVTSLGFLDTSFITGNQTNKIEKEKKSIWKENRGLNLESGLCLTGHGGEFGTRRRRDRFQSQRDYFIDILHSTSIDR